MLWVRTIETDEFLFVTICARRPKAKKVKSLSRDGLLVVIGESVYDVGTLEPARCKDFDEDCLPLAEAGYAAICWQHDRSRGVCPFVGN
jgi:hypothetical protein